MKGNDITDRLPIPQHFANLYACILQLSAISKSASGTKCTCLLNSTLDLFTLARVNNSVCSTGKSNYPPASEANLTERKKSHTCIWCQRICPSVCLSQTLLTPIILGLAEQNGLKLIFHLNRTKNQSKTSLRVWLPELFL